jgi:agmatine deiminase
MSKRIVPAEWAPQRRMWTCWPSAADLWEDSLEPARAEVAAMVRLIAAGQPVTVLAANIEAAASARASLPATVTVVEEAFGDIWLRDTGPIFARDDAGRDLALRFGFNFWGGKYELAGDESVGQRVAERAAIQVEEHSFVLEGGAVDHDGEGTVLTTRQCVLNPNRNPGWAGSEAAAEAALRSAFGARRVLWLDDGLANDHTDGHVDNIARFIAPGVVACMEPFGADDPNAGVLDRIAADLATMTDAAGRRLEVVRIPSPGLVSDSDGQAVPASHMNFIIANGTVVMPHYSTASADEALRRLQARFPGRRVHGVRSSAVLSGGGSFHCITQQEPQ